MKLWLRRIAVALITIMTLGQYVPPIYLPPNAEENREEDVTSGHTTTQDVLPVATAPTVGKSDLEDLNHSEDFIQTFTEEAKEKVFMKLGPKIINRVEDEFTTDIFPCMEEALERILEGNQDDDYTYYGITAGPTKGYGERIFNVYDYRTDKEVAQFHVRRENRPLEGYYFNFHYHLSDDHFEEHHHIGDIYWDKNRPPKWMS